MAVEWESKGDQVEVITIVLGQRWYSLCSTPWWWTRVGRERPPAETSAVATRSSRDWTLVQVSSAGLARTPSCIAGTVRRRRRHPRRVLHSPGQTQHRRRAYPTPLTTSHRPALRVYVCPRAVIITENYRNLPKTYRKLTLTLSPTLTITLNP